MSKNHEDLIATEIRKEGEEMVWPDEWNVGIIGHLEAAIDRGMAEHNLTPTGPKFLRFDVEQHTAGTNRVHISMIQRGKK